MVETRAWAASILVSLGPSWWKGITFFVIVGRLWSLPAHAMATRLFQSLLDQRACEECVLKPMCRPAIVRPDELEQLADRVMPRRTVAMGERIYEQGSRVRSLYISQAGVLKTEVLTAEGQVQVLGFHFPGELMGLEAVAGGRFRASAVALEPCIVCEVPLDALETAASRRPEFQSQLLHAAGSCLASQQDHLSLLAMRQADERIALFLVGLLDRSELRSGHRESTIHLAMGRSDLGSYLCLTIETVSRTLSAMRDGGLLDVKGRSLVVLDRAQLFARAGVPLQPSARKA